MIRGLLLAGVLLRAGHALALACPCSPATQVFPPAGTVPRNVVFQVSRLAVDPFFHVKLVDSTSGLPVRCSVIERTASWVSITPDELPAAGTRLTLTTFESSSEYVVSDAVDEAPPAEPVLTAAEGRFSVPDECGLAEEVQLSVQRDEEETLLIAFAGPTEASTSGESHVAATADAKLLDGPCRRDVPIAQMPTVAVSLALVDAAGNLSSASRPQLIKAAGCSASGGGVLTVLALALARRQRTRSR